MSQADITTKPGRSAPRWAWACLGAGTVLFVGGLIFGFYLQTRAHERRQTISPTHPDLEASLPQADVSAITGLVVAVFGLMLLLLALLVLSRRKVDLDRDGDVIPDPSGRWSDRAS